MIPQYTGMKVLQTHAYEEKRKKKSTHDSLIPGRTHSVRAHLHQLLLVAEVRDQDVFSVRHPGEGDSQSPAGVMVTICWKSAAHHVTNNLHQVKRRMHGAEEPLPRLLCNINDARTSFSCRQFSSVNNETFPLKTKTNVINKPFTNRLLGRLVFLQLQIDAFMTS